MPGLRLRGKDVQPTGAEPAHFVRLMITALS